MYTARILNPKSNRQVACKIFEISYPEFKEVLKAGGVKGLSWHLLDQPHSIRTMEATEYGDSAANNFALSVFENALDWQLGLTAVKFVKALAQIGKKPKVIRLAVTRGGDVYVVSSKLEILM